MTFYDEDHSWLHHPFEWWIENEEPPVSVLNLNGKSGLNVMAALNDIYLSLKDRKVKEALTSLELLATSFIAVALGKSDVLIEAVTESTIDGTDFDAELSKLLEEEGDNNDKA